MRQILLRVPDELHAAIEAAARADGRSLNNMITRWCQHALVPTATRRTKGMDPPPGWGADFERWYSVYPRHVGRAAAEKAWLALKPSSELVITLMAAVELWRPHWAAMDTKFVPHPATWLRNRRWEDEPPAPRQTGVSMAGLAAAAERGPQ